MPAIQTYTQSANAYQGAWAFPQRSPVGGLLALPHGVPEQIFAFDTMLTDRGGPMSSTVLGVITSNVAFGMVLTCWINLTAVPGVSSLLIEVDLGTGVLTTLTSFPLIAGLQQCVTPVLAAFAVYGTATSANDSTITWHCQMANY